MDYFEVVVGNRWKPIKEIVFQL